MGLKKFGSYLSKAWFCDGVIRYILCLRCFVSYCCSVTIILSLMFSISLVTLGSIIIVISQSYSTKNVSDVFKETQRMYLLHISTLTAEWLEQMPKLIENMDEWFKHQDKIGNFDLKLRSNTTFGIDSVMNCIKFLKGISKMTENVDALAYGSRVGSLCGYLSPPLDMGMHEFNQTGQRPEECCPYTMKDLTSGKTEGLPGILRGWFMDGLEFKGGLRAHVPLGVFPYDFRLIPWYKAALSSTEENGYAWSNHFVAKVGDAATSFSKRFYDSNGTFAGVLIVMVTRNMAINYFLESLSVEDGIVFMVDSKGSLIGTTNDSPTVKIDAVTGFGHPVFANEVKDPVIKESYEYILKHHSSEGNVDSVLGTIRKKELTINGDLYLLEAGKIIITDKMKILLVYVVKSDVIFESINKGNITSIMICIGFIIFISFCSSLLICIILLPLVSLSKQMKKVETMKLDKIKIRHLSFFKEIRNVQKRFQFCVVKLKEYSAFLPDYLKHDSKRVIIFEKKILPSNDPTKELIRSPLKKNSSFEKSPLEIITTSPLKNTQEENSSEENSPISSDGDRSSSNRTDSTCSSLDSTCSSLSSFEEDDDIGSETTLITPQDKFGLGISRRVVVCLFLYLSNWKDLIQSDFSSYCDVYFNFLDYVTVLVRKYGSIFRFDVDRIVIYYPRSSMKMALMHAKNIFQVVKTKRYTFKVIMGLSLDLSVVGVIGHNMMKTRCVFDGAIEKSKYLIDCFLSSERTQEKIKKKEEEEDCCNLPQCVFLIESVSESEIVKSPYFKSLKLSCVPLNVLAYISNDLRENGFFTLYRVFFEDNENSNTEWMYQLDRENKEKERLYFLTAFNELISGNIKKSKEYLMMVLKRKSGGGKRFEHIQENEDDEVLYKSEIIEMDGHVSDELEKCYLELSPKKLLEVLEEIEKSSGMDELLKDRCFMIDPSVVFTSKEKLSKVFGE